MRPQEKTKISRTRKKETCSSIVWLWTKYKNYMLSIVHTGDKSLWSWLEDT